MTHKTAAPDRTLELSTSCTYARDAGRFVITVSGDLDFAAVDDTPLRAALSSYRSDEPLDIVLDLGGVSFVDSVGLSWLMSVRSAATLANRRLRLRSSSPTVDKVLATSAMTRYFPVEASSQADAPETDAARR